MIEVPITERTQSYIQCPKCKENYEAGFGVRHLLIMRNTSFGPWYCNSCGTKISGEIKDGRVFIVEHPESERKRSIAVLLRRNNLYLVVKGMAFRDKDKDEEEHQRFYYEEHTCSMNYMREIIEVWESRYDKLEVDPHGLFEYVRSVENDCDREQDWECVFPELKQAEQENNLRTIAKEIAQALCPGNTSRLQIMYLGSDKKETTDRAGWGKKIIEDMIERILSERL